MNVSVATSRTCSLLLALYVIMPQAFADEPFLATLTIERAASADSPLQERALFSLHLRSPKQAAEILSKIDGIDVLSVNEGIVRISAISQPTVAVTVEDRFDDNTFVIDYEEPAIQSLQQDVLEQYGDSPTDVELTNFVYEFIADKNYSRSFDLASKVADTAAGDCTEHAVLLTALMRANGKHARVVFGSLVIESSDRLLAYGHA